MQSALTKMTEDEAEAHGDALRQAAPCESSAAGEESLSWCSQSARLAAMDQSLSWCSQSARLAAMDEKIGGLESQLRFVKQVCKELSQSIGNMQMLTACLPG